MAVMRLRPRYSALSLWFLGKLARAAMSLSVKSMASSFCWSFGAISKIHSLVDYMNVSYRDETQVFQSGDFVTFLVPMNQLVQV